MAPSPQHGTRVRASIAAARKAARSGGDNGPARREISASGSRSLTVDIDGSAWNKLAVLTQCDRQRLGPLPGGPFLCRADLDSHATDGYGRLCSCTGPGPTAVAEGRTGRCRQRVRQLASGGCHACPKALRNDLTRLPRGLEEWRHFHRKQDCIGACACPGVLGPSCVSQRRSSNANTLQSQNSDGSPQICAIFKEIISVVISEIAVGTLITERPPQSGRVEARIGLRMMPTFPRPSLSFRTAGFPRYGWKAGM